MIILISAICLGCCIVFCACGDKDDVEVELNDKEYIVSPWQTEDEYTLYLQDGAVVSDTDYIVCLEKPTDRDFRILNLTDIHLANENWEKDDVYLKIFKKTFEKLVDENQPDLITLSGDQGWAEADACCRLSEYIDSFGIPWAPVFGNHDCQETDCTLGYLSWVYAQYEHCLYRVGPADMGVTSRNKDRIGNYIINVYERDDSAQGFKVVQSVIMFNSADSQHYEPSDYDVPPATDWDYAQLSARQKDWYKWAVSGVQKYGKDDKVKSTIVLHIPIYEYMVAYNAARNTRFSLYDYNKAVVFNFLIPLPASYHGFGWKEGYKDSFGVKRELSGSTPYPDGVFDCIMDYDDDPDTDYVSTGLVVCGHDHISNTVINYKGVTLAYGLTTGKGTSYWHRDMNGGSLIAVDGSGGTVIEHKYDYSTSLTMYEWWMYPIFVVVPATIIALIIIAIKKKKTRKRSNNI